MRNNEFIITHYFIVIIRNNEFIITHRHIIIICNNEFIITYFAYRVSEGAQGHVWQVWFLDWSPFHVGTLPVLQRRQRGQGRCQPPSRLRRWPLRRCGGGGVATFSAIPATERVSAVEHEYIFAAEIQHDQHQFNRQTETVRQSTLLGKRKPSANQLYCKRKPSAFKPSYCKRNPSAFRFLSFADFEKHHSDF